MGCQKDRVISFVTAFESLFLKKNDSKKRRLGKRVPNLLTSPAGLAGVRQNVDDIWELRSNIVHAQPYQPTEPARLVSITELYARESIRRYVALQSHIGSNNHNGILSWLDDPAVHSMKQADFPQWAAL